MDVEQFYRELTNSLFKFICLSDNLKVQHASKVNRSGNSALQGTSLQLNTTGGFVSETIPGIR